MSELGFWFMLFVAAFMIVAPFLKNNTDKCIHLWDHRRHKVKCFKCGQEELK